MVFGSRRVLRRRVTTAVNRSRNTTRTNVDTAARPSGWPAWPRCPALPPALTACLRYLSIYPPSTPPPPSQDGCLTSFAALFAAHCPSPSRRHHMLRTILALALASSAWADTICSLEPTICDGTYSGTELCAPLHRPPLPCTNEGGCHLRAGVGRAAPGGDGGQPSRRGRVAYRVVATRTGEAHRASDARRGSDAPTGTPLHPSSCSGAPRAGTFTTRA